MSERCKWIEGCSDNAKTRGLCNKHYLRWWRSERRDATAAPRKLIHSRWRQPGDRWVNVNGYAWLKLTDGTLIAEHKHVMQVHLGRALVKGENVHHINGDRADNRLENLELWFKAQPAGQRVADLIAYLVEHHEDEIRQRLNRNTEVRGNA